MEPRPSNPPTARCWPARATRRAATSCRCPGPEAGGGRQSPMSSHPYEHLTPDVVLDALSCVGLHGDGRLMALSSYENRVYQVHLEDPFEGHPIVVAKFYRPERWSEAQIL